MRSVVAKAYNEEIEGTGKLSLFKSYPTASPTGNSAAISYLSAMPSMSRCTSWARRAGLGLFNCVQGVARTWLRPRPDAVSTSLGRNAPDRVRRHAEHRRIRDNTRILHPSRYGGELRAAGYDAPFPLFVEEGVDEYVGGYLTKRGGR